MTRRVCLILVTLLLMGCSQQKTAPTITARPTQTASPSATPTFTLSPAPPTATLTSTPQVPTTTPGLTICSPLDGIFPADLSANIFNPYAPPRSGSDDPHQGVDFADIDPIYQIALEGRLVNAVIEGTVAGVIHDRFPYGNAVLVETPLERLPAQWLATHQIPTPAPLVQGHPSLTCPQSTVELEPNSEPRSLYLMYAHLKEPVKLEPGETVICGQPIGAIGNSGNSLNPHLHLELRVGPADIRFESMAHYTGSATSIEMANYCLWRVSGAFQLLDPMLLFSPAQ